MEFILGIESCNMGMILCIHGEDEIELLEVLFFKLASFSCTWDISALERLAHSVIRRFA